MAGNSIPKRSEIKESDKWDLSRIYKTPLEWERAFESIKSMGEGVLGFKGKLSSGPGVFLECLKLMDDLNVEIGKLAVYAYMKRDEDVSDENAKAASDRAMSLSVEMSSKLSFFEPEVLSMDESLLWSYLKGNPDLELYGFYLESIIRQKAHILPEREEKLLASMGEISEAPEEIFTMLTNGDMVFPKIKDESGEEAELSEERYYRFLRSENRQVRKDAFAGIHGSYRNLSNTIGASYSSCVKKDVFYARARNYGDSLERALEPNRIPRSVYENLLSSVEKGLPLLHRYVALKRKALKLPDIHMYDLYVPLAEEPKGPVPFEEAKKIVLEGLAPMGEDYLKVLRQGLEGRWVDVYENQGKKKGAYSWGSYGTDPYVLLNYDGALKDVFTLAHEMGHSLHSWHSHKNQPPIYGDYCIFVAEVASTTNEILLMEHLLKTRPKDRAFLLSDYLEQIRQTVFRQTLFAEFELKTHRAVEAGEALTPGGMAKLWKELNEKYYGPEIVVDEHGDYEWARIPHFYSAFYVYQYATGYSAATVLADLILNGGEKAKKAYMEFLSGGSSKYPVDLLRGAGVDMEDPQSLKPMLKAFSDKLGELEALIL